MQLHFNIIYGHIEPRYEEYIGEEPMYVREM